MDLQILSEEEHSRINEAWREMELDTHYVHCLKDLHRHVHIESHHARFFKTQNKSYYTGLNKEEVARSHSEFVFKYRIYCCTLCWIAT